MIRPLNDRLDLLSRGSSRVKEYLQHPSDAENLLFGGSERNLLETMRDAIRSADSSFHEQVGKVVNDVPIQAQDLAQSAEAARDERSAASSSGAAPAPDPEGGRAGPEPAREGWHGSRWGPSRIREDHEPGGHRPWSANPRSIPGWRRSR